MSSEWVVNRCFVQGDVAKGAGSTKQPGLFFFFFFEPKPVESMKTSEYVVPDHRTRARVRDGHWR